MLLPGVSGMFMGAYGSGTEEEMVTENEKCPRLRGRPLSSSFHVYSKARQDDGRN